MLRRFLPVAGVLGLACLVLGGKVPAQPVGAASPASETAMTAAPQVTGDARPAPPDALPVEANANNGTNKSSKAVSSPDEPKSDAPEADGTKPEEPRTPESGEAGTKDRGLPETTAGAADAGHQLEGKISYYGHAFKGRRTACGTHFNPNELTMAHKTLPCGTLAKVTNLRNGHWTVVHVTDHGPNVKGRVADLSLAAARQMGLLHHGITHGRLEVLKMGTPRRPPAGKR